VIDGDGSVVHTVVLDRPRPEVFAFFTDARSLVRWIGISADLDPHVGGVFRFEIEPGGFYRIATPLLAAMVKRNISRDYRTLARTLEAR